MTKRGGERYAEQLCDAFPSRLAPLVGTVAERLPAAEFAPTAGFAVTLRGERLCIPYRVYYREPAPAYWASLSNTEALISAGVYTRHHNGFVRERHLEQLLEADVAWASPFILQLLGEYVVEILMVLLAKVDVVRGEHCTRFALENPAFVERTKRRIVSYWDCYYRTEFRRFCDYPGFKIADAMGWWRPRELPNIGPR